MEKPKPPADPPPGEARKGYTAALIHLLADMDFAEARQAAAALGEAADPAAIQALVYLVRESAALRSAAIAALKKLSEENEAAATELAIALLKEKRIELPAEETAPVSERDRRRAPRVLLEIPVVVIWIDQRGTRHTEPTTTKVVNAHGALLHLKNPMVVGMEVEVHNVTTLAKIQARVVWVGDPLPDGGQEIGIELGNPDPDFWVGKSQLEGESSFLPGSP